MQAAALELALYFWILSHEYPAPYNQFSLIPLLQTLSLSPTAYSLVTFPAFLSSLSHAPAAHNLPQYAWLSRGCNRLRLLLFIPHVLTIKQIRRDLMLCQVHGEELVAVVPYLTFLLVGKRKND